MKDTIRGTKINLEIKNIIKIYKYILEDLFPLYFSHHPNCEKFNSDVFIFGKWRFCIGCFVLYPTFFFTFLLLFLLDNYGLLIWYYLLFIAIVTYSSLILKYLGLTSSRFIKIIVSFFLGLGAATFLWGLILSPVSIFFTIPLFLFINIIIAITGIYRIKNFLKTCDNCEYKAKWNICPGLKEPFEKLEKDGFDISSHFKYNKKIFN